MKDLKENVMVVIILILGFILTLSLINAIATPAEANDFGGLDTPTVVKKNESTNPLCKCNPCRCVDCNCGVTSNSDIEKVQRLEEEIKVLNANLATLHNEIKELKEKCKTCPTSSTKSTNKTTYNTLPQVNESSLVQFVKPPPKVSSENRVIYTHSSPSLQNVTPNTYFPQQRIETRPSTLKTRIINTTPTYNPPFATFQPQRYYNNTYPPFSSQQCVGNT